MMGTRKQHSLLPHRLTGLIAGMALAGSITVSAGPASASSVKDLYANLRLTTWSNLEKIVRTVANVGIPRQVKIEIGGTINAQIERRCGRVDPTYVKIVLDRNTGLTAESLVDTNMAGRTVTLPACLRYPAARTFKADNENGSINSVSALAAANNVPFNALYYESLAGKKDVTLPEALSAVSEQFVTCSAALGVGKLPAEWILNALTPKIYHECRNALEIATANPSLDPRAFDTEAVRIPAQPVLSSIRLAHASDIAALSALPGIEVVDRSDPGLSIMFQQADYTTKANNTCLSSSENNPNWPFDSVAVLNALALNYLGRPGNRGRPGRILVVDSGFDFVEVPHTFFPLRYFHNSIDLDESPDYPRNQRDDNGDGIVDNEVAVNLAELTTSGATSNADDVPHSLRSHGLSVTTLALGGLGLQQHRLAGDLPIRVGIGNIVHSVDTDKPIPADRLSTALRYAEKNQFDIVNMSLSTTQASEGLVSTFNDLSEDILVVVAAGNEGDDFETGDAYFPAAFGGDYFKGKRGVTVISVGAHDREFKRAGFSNQGKTNVDLLAAGCDIPTYVLDKDAEYLKPVMARSNGTSFAAPIVSFVAGLLKAERLTPTQIKDRLLISVDIHSHLKEAVVSSGVLNPARALVLYHDQITGPSKNIRYGAIQNKNAVVTVCGADMRLNSIRRIWKDTGGGKLRVRFVNPESAEPDKLRQKNCDLATADLAGLQFMFAELDAPKPVPYTLSDFSDILFSIN